MLITLYNTPSSNNTADKDLSAPLSGAITVTPLGAVSITRPVFIIDYDESLLTANYAKIQTTDTDLTGAHTFYYYCLVTTDNGGRMVLTCKRDPLTSFKTQIRACPATVIRYERKKNGRTGATKVVDSKYPIVPNKENVVSTIAVNNGLFNSDTQQGANVMNYALTVINGGASV